MAATRWGICGTGLISNDFVTVLKSLPASEHQVVAVAARSDKTKAESFAKKYGIPAAYGTYEDLAKDPNVDIVYVGTTHLYHCEVCLLYFDNGKHVLCEKPMTMTLKECEMVIAKAREKKVFFMEGFWTRFFPAYISAVDVLKSGSLGDIACIRATFAIPSETDVLLPNNRTFTGSSLIAGGCYPIMYVQQVFKERPEKIVANGQFMEKGGDIGGSLILQYKGGQLGILYHHSEITAGGSDVVVHGTQGTMQIHHDMHTPTRVTCTYPRRKSETREFPLPATKESFNWWNSQAMVYEVQAVRDCLLKGLTECPQMTHEDSLTIMYVIEEGLKQLG